MIYPDDSSFPSSAFAAFRKSPRQEDLSRLASEHLKHDLTEGDRDILAKASSRISTRATVGSILGLGLGVYMAYGLRRGRVEMFNAFRTARKPVQVTFADGTTEKLPDLTRIMQPTAMGDVLTYLLCGLGGLFFGGETGFLAGTWSATRAIRENPETERRIGVAYRRFKADFLRREAERLEAGGPIDLF